MSDDSNTNDDEKTSSFTLRPASSVRRAKQIKKNSEAAKNVDYSSTLGGEKDASDIPEWARALKEQMEQNAERIDALSKQTGSPESQQLGKAAGENRTSSGFTLDPRKTRSTSAADDQDSEENEKSSGFTLDPREVN